MEVAPCSSRKGEMENTLCAHTLDRVIEHETSGVSVRKGKSVHTPGDRIVLTCPRGCPDIIVNVIPDFEEEEL